MVRESHPLHITRSWTIAHHIRWGGLLPHHRSTRRNGLETLTPRSHTWGVCHLWPAPGPTWATKSHATRWTWAHMLPHLIHHVIGYTWISYLVWHHLIVFGWRLPRILLLLQMHRVLLLHLLLMLLLLHLHHHLGGHLGPHMGMGSHGTHPVVGPHFHLVGSHHLHLLHALLLHHHLLLLMLLLGGHDTIWGHLWSHSWIRHVRNVARTSHWTLLSSGNSHATWRSWTWTAWTWTTWTWTSWTLPRLHGLTHRRGTGVAQAVPTLGGCSHSDIWHHVVAIHLT